MEEPEELPFEQKVRDSVICCALTQKKCKVKGIVGLIRQIIPKVNEITAKANIVLTSHVLKMIKEGTNFDDDFIMDRKFVKHCFYVTYTKDPKILGECRDLGLIDTVEKIDCNGVFVPDAKHVCNTLQYDVDQVRTTIKNYLSYKGLKPHVIKYLQARYHIRKKWMAKWLFGHICSKQVRVIQSIPPKILRLISHVDDPLLMLQGIIHEERQLYHS